MISLNNQNNMHPRPEMIRNSENIYDFFYANVSKMIKYCKFQNLGQTLIHKKSEHMNV